MIRFHPAASQEFAADTEHYEKQRPDRGRRFADAIDLALARIAAAPLSQPVLAPPGIRSIKVERFPYRVIYVAVGPDVGIIAVAHSRRRPGYWRRRVSKMKSAAALH